MDGEAAFPSVEREIQIRELYANGERADYLEYSKHTYENTDCHLTQNGMLSRRIKNIKETDKVMFGHFKGYINPLLNTLNSSNLGFRIGPLCITTVCVADDTYVLTSSPSALQSALNIVSQYGHKYQLWFNAGKTKITVTGSKLDMEYYKDTHPWQLNGDTVPVVENNELL